MIRYTFPTSDVLSQISLILYPASFIETDNADDTFFDSSWMDFRLFSVSMISLWRSYDCVDLIVEFTPFKALSRPVVSPPISTVIPFILLATVTLLMLNINVVARPQ